MAIYEVFSHPSLVKYKTSICTKTTLFFTAVSLFTFLLPLLLTYTTQDFWKQIDYYREQPDISFKHKMLLVLETKNPNELIFWSTYGKLNDLISHEFQQLIPSIEHREEDFNKDKKHDELQMTIDVPVSTREIVSVKLIIIFDFKLSQFSNIHMECAAYLHYNSPLPGSSLKAIGELTVKQKLPLEHASKNDQYNVAVIDDSVRNAASLKLESILLQYARRNISTALDNLYFIWGTGRSSSDFFKINLVVMYPEQTILYKVGLWQLIKWAVVQYIAFFIIFSYVCYKIKLYVFSKQFLPTIVISPMKQHL